MSILRLKDHIAWRISERLDLHDTRNFHIVANDTTSFVYADHDPGDTPYYVHVLAHLTPELPVEQWQAEADPDHQRITWRANTAEPLSLTLRLPRQEAVLEMWHTGRAQQLLNDAVPGVGMENGPSLMAAGEREVLFYSGNPRNCLLLHFSRPGTLTITKGQTLLPAVVGTPVWELVSDAEFDLPNKPETTITDGAQVGQLTWEARWESEDAGEVELVVYQGLVDVARHFEGRLPLHLPDVSADFGPFFYQMVLGAVPLNIREFDAPLLATRDNVILGDVPAYADAWSRDTAFGYEYFARVDPLGTARLVEDYIRLAAKYSQEADPDRSPVPGFIHRDVAATPPKPGDYWDDSAPELLMLAELHFRLTADEGFLREHFPLYRRCADFILSLVRPGERLPITRGTWDAQGVLIGKEPYFTAECFVALKRFGALLKAVGTLDERYTQAAAAMKVQANKGYHEGGLWHTERGTFINHIDYKPPHLLSPRTESWVTADPVEAGRPRTEFALYETVVPIALGLLDDPERIRAAFAWIDATYTYASGRGGVTFPPFYQQTFIGLLDVEARHRYGLPGADRLLQLILDRALDGGIPITEWHFGAYRQTGNVGANWGISFYPHTHSGRVWDNAPYFGLVMDLHYGLSYTHAGWHLRDPKPLGDYPLTAVNDLRYHEASFNLRWEGSGAIDRILIDGEDWPHRRLDLREGTHEVSIILKEADHAS